MKGLHFTTVNYTEGRSWLKVCAIPIRFPWNNFHIPPQRLSAFQRATIQLGVDAQIQEPSVVLEAAPNETSIEEPDCVACPPSGKHIS